MCLNTHFRKRLTITDKIVGGCNNTNYDYKGKAKHRGGYLLGDADSEYPFIKLNIRNKFMPKEKNGAYVGGNVYGGCFKSGTIVGDVLINLQSDMLAGKDKDKLEKSNELLVKRCRIFRTQRLRCRIRYGKLHLRNRKRDNRRIGEMLRAKNGRQQVSALRRGRPRQQSGSVWASLPTSSTAEASRATWWATRLSRYSTATYSAPSRAAHIRAMCMAPLR